MPEESYLQIRGLTKTFGSFVALKDISLDVYEGEFICFLGPSGCGKTTLLRLIAGLEEQDTGTIIQNGRDISRLPPSRRDFGIVFQSYALFPNLTAEKNIAYGLQNEKGFGESLAVSVKTLAANLQANPLGTLGGGLMGLTGLRDSGIYDPQIKARVDELLELVGLPDSGRKYPAQLSGGQQQRIALARALALSPGLLLLDEPLSALDARVRASLRHEVVSLQKRLGVTTVMVTHDQEEALTMADRIVVMDHGSICQIGTPLDIYREPAQPFVADFVGQTNFISGFVQPGNTVRVGATTFQAETIPGDLKPGAAATLSVRPEDIRIGDVKEGEGNILEVRIADIRFLGSFYRLELAPPNTDVPLLLTADVSIQKAQMLEIAPDMRLTIQLPARNLRVYHGQHHTE